MTLRIARRGMSRLPAPRPTCPPPPCGQRRPCAAGAAGRLPPRRTRGATAGPGGLPTGSGNRLPAGRRRRRRLAHGACTVPPWRPPARRSARRPSGPVPFGARSVPPSTRRAFAAPAFRPPIRLHFRRASGAPPRTGAPARGPPPRRARAPRASPVADRRTTAGPPPPPPRAPRTVAFAVPPLLPVTRTRGGGGGARRGAVLVDRLGAGAVRWPPPRLHQVECTAFEIVRLRAAMAHVRVLGTAEARGWSRQAPWGQEPSSRGLPLQRDIGAARRPAAW